MDLNLKTSDVILIAASDSSDRDKTIAHLCCDGKNDQDVIQEAVDTISTENAERSAAQESFSYPAITIFPIFRDRITTAGWLLCLERNQTDSTT
jgi:hypothetical protein